MPHEPPRSGGFACLGRKGSDRSSLANHTGATVQVAIARCKNGSSKLRSFEPRSLPRRRRKMVLIRDFAVQKSEAAKL